MHVLFYIVIHEDMQCTLLDSELQTCLRTLVMTIASSCLSRCESKLYHNCHITRWILCA